MEYILTHSDLDGLACETVAKAKYPNIKSKRVGYEKAVEECRKILAEKPDILIIADLWPRDTDIFNELVDYPGRLLIFDHHDSSTHNQRELIAKRKLTGKKVTVYEPDYLTPSIPSDEGGDVLVFGNNGCSAYHARWYLNVDLPMIDEVNIFDLSGTIEGLPGALNTLYYSMPRSDMRELLNRKVTVLNQEEKTIIAKQLEQSKLDFNEASKTFAYGNVGYKNIVWVEYNRSKSYIFETLLKDNDCVILLDSKKNTLSLRSNFDGVNLVAEKYGGGGHRRAAGCPYTGVTFNEIIKTLKEVI